jgi:glycosyltransferase involved in cell wall biosynthesis
MRLVVHDYAGHPFQAQLSRELAHRGHTVTHVTCKSYVSGKGQLSWQVGDPPTLDFIEIPLRTPHAKYSYGKRLLQEREYAKAFLALPTLRTGDTVVSSNVPLFAHSTISQTLVRRRCPEIFWHQDVYSEAIAREAMNKLGVLGRLIGYYAELVESRIARRSLAVIAITDAFLPVLQKWHVSPERVHVIPNWAPLSELPIRDGKAFRRQHSIDEAEIALYAGTLGIKHDVSHLLQLAAALKQFRPSALLLVVTSDDAGDALREKARHQRLDDHVVVLPYQPYELLPDVLGSAHVLLALLSGPASKYSVPSKVLSYMCAGKPIVAAIADSNSAAHMLEAEGAGLVTPPSDAEAFAEAVMVLLGDDARRSAMGRAARSYAEHFFEISRIADNFESILAQ